MVSLRRVRAVWFCRWVWWTVLADGGNVSSKMSDGVLLVRASAKSFAIAERLGDLTLRYSDVAREFGVTRERVRQIARLFDLNDDARVQRHRGYSLSPSLWQRSHWPREGIEAYKRKHGYCAVHSCRDPVVRRRVLCAWHLWHNNQRHQASRWRKLANGLCGQSGCSNERLPNHTMCGQCLEAMRTRDRRKRKLNRTGGR